MKTESKSLLEPRVPRALMDRYAAIVRRHAFRLARRLPSHIRAEDLISAGFLGLADALRRSDHSDTSHFEAYAEFRIRGAMLDELRSRDPLSRDLRSLNRKIVATVGTLTVELGRPPEEIEIAQRLGLSVGTFRDQLAKVSVGAFLSLATGGSEMDDVELSDDTRETADSYVLRSERRDKLASMLQQLPPRLQELLRLSFEQDYTLREIGEHLGVTESRVCQLHAEAILRLRAAYVAKEDHDEDLTNLRRPRMRRRRSESVGQAPMRRAG